MRPTHNTDRSELKGASCPKLLVTIDTEPDDEWACKPTLTTENVRELPRLQEIFDRHGVRPTYFVSYAVARDLEATEILAAIRSEGKCEIGSHLHPWNTPPYFKISGEARQSHAYLYRYPEEVQRGKFETLHGQLAKAFGFEPRSHRAGRYGLDGYGVRLLKEFGYSVDSSVPPMINWCHGQAADEAGPDFRRAPLGSYELSDDDPSTPGHGGVIEVPVSVGYTRAMPRCMVNWLKVQRPENLAVRALGKLCGIRKRWFRPFPHVPLEEARLAGQWLLNRGTGFLNMMFHSSELIPNTQYSKTEAEVDAFLGVIEKMIIVAGSLGCRNGATLAEFGQEHKRTRYGMALHQVDQ